MAEKYTYNITDFLNNIANLDSLIEEIGDSDITIVLDYINSTESEVDLWFKASLPGGDLTTLSGVVATHVGAPPAVITAPVTIDGRPIVRADSRPLETETYFTMAGDTASGVGEGAAMRWNMDDDDDWEDIGDGILCKTFEITFNNEIYLKDGSIYFFNAPWGSYVDFYIVVPAGGYYPNPYGSIPASALGQPGGGMWEYASADVLYQCYVNRHYMNGDCPMGDELNAEGAAINGLPVGWKLLGHVHAPATASGTGFKGYASVECYRERTVVLPGDPLGPPTD
jgi:hypothetical protein